MCWQKNACRNNFWILTRIPSSPSRRSLEHQAISNKERGNNSPVFFGNGFHWITRDFMKTSVSPTMNNSNNNVSSALTKAVVLKFGGTSVSTAANWKNIADIVKARIAEGLHPIVVHSAISKMTDGLEKLLSDALH